MRFTYEAYKGLLYDLIDCGYHFSGYHDWQEVDCPVILRHDIDNDIDKAVQLAALEHSGGEEQILCTSYLKFLQCVFQRILRWINEDRELWSYDWSSF